ncbi:MAG: CxxxxCH/CxxCH domain-containing protein [Ignavibacteria bacterium]|nr:CxxxxCH/CxxCH domain-containing protein [Ignavibacteria bacterium]
MKKIFIFYSLIILTVFGFIYGCSEVKNDLVMAPSSAFHGDGWLNTVSANFHGKYIASNSWDINGCKSCHGADFSGGTAKASCLTCHENGPDACNTCHGNQEHIYPPRSLFGNTLNTQTGVGAHEQHMTNDTTQRYSAVVDCEQCHIPLTGFSDSNHIKKNQSFATVVFGDLARKTTEGVTPNPQWDRSTQTCTNVYCHGTFKNGNQSAEPKFTDPTSVRCGSCHGDPVTGNPLPGGTHPTLAKCYLCHGGVIDSSGVIINQSLHINGVVNFSTIK